MVREGTRSRNPEPPLAGRLEESDLRAGNRPVSWWDVQVIYTVLYGRQKARAMAIRRPPDPDKSVYWSGGSGYFEETDSASADDASR